ncbi:2'-5' RNA ligase family protein [Occultella gossypii]|uniref:2'-5' RNA ligase family protein n=1 Tax=Occultella gossypii TaxID=2800820 RepID=A0ABS7SBE4_9MICO|nr:2'-5' RNA ligase family protein [Occultella gossypii]MBZ2197673.1 2'-5' RNA ligase family protein [Occultella gossypii]
MSAPERMGAQVRIGVSIPIPEPYSATLTRARIEAGDPLAHSVPPHITLMPPAVVEPDDLAEVTEHLRTVAAEHPPFVVELGGTDSFRPISPVVFVRLAAGTQACERLQRAINAGPLRQELRFPYHPHVTIAHEIDDAGLDAANAAMEAFDAVFPVAHFSLYEYGDDGVWRGVRNFVLTS